jgi:flagellin FlaB
MKERIHNLFRDESGVTALETAIILIAFVVVASVFAFTVLTAGTFSTERSRQAVYAGLEQVTSSMEVYGSVIGETTGDEISDISFTLAVVSGGSGVNMTQPGDEGNVVVMSYLADNNYTEVLTWTSEFLGDDDGDNMLETGELCKVSIPLTPTNSIHLGTSMDFRIEVKPPQGGVLPIIRHTTASLDEHMVLD